MVTFTGMPSPSTMFSAYSSLSASIMVAQTAFNNLVPHQLQNYITTAIRNYFKPKSAKHLFIIEEKDVNEIYSAAQHYLYSKMDSSIHCLKITKRARNTRIHFKFAKCDNISDFYQGIAVTWKFNCEKSRKRNSDGVCKSERFFELSFDKSEREKVMNFYIPFVLQKAKEIRDAKTVVNLYTLISSSDTFKWKHIRLEHPTTFENLAMEKSMKQAIIEDLNIFVTRKDFYRKVGKAWKRGYLLYGPPGTGKSSLVAAMANYLKFHVYDLELTNIKKDSDLRSLLLRTENRSILVIEDIDCSVHLPNRNTSPVSDAPNQKLPFTLSRLLNFIDGLWSSCGDERIFVFTTNHKDRLDPALLRPGRMDMHISMSYLTIDGLELLLSNYLNIIDDDQHECIHEIKDLIGSMNVTPAEVAGELMKSDDPEVSLMGLIKFLKRKKIDDQELKYEGAEATEIEEIPKGKKVKVDINQQHDESTEDKDCS